MDQLVGSNLIACADTPPITRKIDLMKVKALPFRQDGTGTVYWMATVGGKRYGPYAQVESLFKEVEGDIHGSIGSGYRFGG